MGLIPSGICRTAFSLESAARKTLWVRPPPALLDSRIAWKSISFRLAFAFGDRFATEMRPIALRILDVECGLVVEDLIHAVVADAIARLLQEYSGLQNVPQGRH